ncbi:MAG: ABC transporter permease subunit [Actinomycetota bacterium]|nr:ABC transporter permease subunit [Actinomycetota bacterium]
MFHNIFLKTLWERKKSIIWWSIGLALTGAFIVALFPTVEKASLELSNYMEVWPDELKAAFNLSDALSISTIEGFLNAELFSMMGPILILFFSVGFGAGVIAGEEEKGTIDLLLSHPIGRTRVAVEKYLAGVVGLIVISASFYLGMSLPLLLLKIDINLLKLAQACLGLFLLGLSFSSLAFALGSATGKRGLTLGLTSSIAVMMYLADTLAALVDKLEPYEAASLFYYFNATDIFLDGLSLKSILIYLVCSLLFLALAIVGFNRRDLAV